MTHHMWGGGSIGVKTTKIFDTTTSDRAKQSKNTNNLKVFEIFASVSWNIF